MVLFMEYISTAISSDVFFSAVLFITFCRINHYGFFSFLIMFSLISTFLVLGICINEICKMPLNETKYVYMLIFGSLF